MPVGCIQQRPACTEEISGLCVMHGPDLVLDIDEIGVAVALVESHLRKVGIEFDDFETDLRLNNVVVNYTTQHLATRCTDLDYDLQKCEHIAAGVCYGTEIYVVYQPQGVAFDALVHELLHTAEYLYTDGMTYDHSTPYFFSACKEAKMHPELIIESNVLKLLAERYLDRYPNP